MPYKIILKHSQQRTNPSVLGGNEMANTAEYVQLVYEKLKRYPEFEAYIVPDNPDSNATYAWINRLQPDAAIDHHLNAGGGKGAEIFCYMKGISLALAERIYEELALCTPWNDRGLKDGMAWNGVGQGFIKYIHYPSMLIELLFQDSMEQMQFFIDNMDALAEAEVKGICRYFNVIYKGDDIMRGIILLFSKADAFAGMRLMDRLGYPMVLLEKAGEDEVKAKHKIQVGGSVKFTSDTELIAGGDSTETDNKVTDYIKANNL